jgi:flavin-dependent dehydrogenase
LTEKIRIIGAGPAGASLSYFLRDTEYKVLVYDYSPKPGLKPCGWAVPVQTEKLIPIPEGFKINTIYGHRVFLNSKLVLEQEKRTPWGYIINKPSWLAYLLKESGAEFIRKKACTEKVDNGYINVIATGGYWNSSPKDKINAVHTMVSIKKWPYPDRVEIWFNTDFIGYYWVFPHSEKKIDVGVGGYKTFSELKLMLKKFLNTHPELTKDGEKSFISGAEIVVSGVKEELLNPKKNVFAVGEAVGAVYPLSGEGIRPSIKTSLALSNYLMGKTGNYVKEVQKTGLVFATRIQRKVLETLKNASPSQRLEIIKSVPREWVVAFGLGEFDSKKLLSAIISRGGKFAKLLSKIITVKSR